jgi:hypothetical protein
MLRKCADCGSKKNDTDFVTPWDEFLYHDPTLVFSTLAVDADHCGPHHQSAFCLESYLTTEKPKMFYGLLPCVEPIVRKAIQISNNTAEQNNAGDLACYPFSELAGKKDRAHRRPASRSTKTEKTMEQCLTNTLTHTDAR